MKFALFENSYATSMSTVAERLLSLLSSHGDEVARDITPDVDMVISLGGDGTFLRAAAKVGSLGIPVVGINTGHLGFLADVQTDEIEAFLDSVHHGDYVVRSRAVLRVEVFSPTASAAKVSYALNEVAVTKHDSSAMVSIQTYINGEVLTTYHADGLLVATPTGSTAYSLSAGGPIIHPQSDVMLLTAVAPHSLNMRPIIVAGGSEIDLVVDSRSGRFLIAIDGESESVEAGTRVSICQAPHHINVVKKTGSTWFSTLRKKMMWGVDEGRKRSDHTL